MAKSTPTMDNPTILTVAGGFYFYGDEVQAPDGYLALKNAAMFGSFEGGKGLPGVARGDAAAKVTLDRFTDDTTLTFPTGTVYAVIPCIDLYSFKGTTLR